MPAPAEPGSDASSPAGVIRLPAPLVRKLHAAARAERWQLSLEQFERALAESVRHHVANAGASEPDGVESYLRSLHLEDLALATACAEGNEAAWEHFIREFRPVLYAAARAISGESQSRELADSIHAELFGVSAEGKERKSLFRYFHGRSKLSTWLRAVLAQRHVDALRASRRTEPLEDDEAGAEGERKGAGGLPGVRIEGTSPDPERARYVGLLQSALTAAIAALEPRDRLRLSSYYVQDLTLAQIGRMLGEHEATVSRKLERTRRELRKHVERILAAAPHRLSDAQVRLCFEYAQQEWPFDLTGALAGNPGPPLASAGGKREGQ